MKKIKSIVVVIMVIAATVFGLQLATITVKKMTNANRCAVQKIVAKIAMQKAAAQEKTAKKNAKK